MVLTPSENRLQWDDYRVWADRLRLDLHHGREEPDGPSAAGYNPANGGLRVRLHRGIAGINRVHGIAFDHRNIHG